MLPPCPLGSRDLAPLRATPGERLYPALGRVTPSMATDVLALAHQATYSAAGCSVDSRCADELVWVEESM
jgi:hypothetical protein